MTQQAHEILEEAAKKTWEIIDKMIREKKDQFERVCKKIFLNESIDGKAFNVNSGNYYKGIIICWDEEERYYYLLTEKGILRVKDESWWRYHDSGNDSHWDYTVVYVDTKQDPRILLNYGGLAIEKLKQL